MPGSLCTGKFVKVTIVLITAWLYSECCRVAAKAFDVFIMFESSTSVACCCLFALIVRPTCLTSHRVQIARCFLCLSGSTCTVQIRISISSVLHTGTMAGIPCKGGCCTTEGHVPGL